MMSLKVIDPCCHGNEKFGILGILTQILPQLRRDTVENLAPNRGSQSRANLSVTISLKFTLDWPLLPW